ncbi:MAG: hypothetical protein A6F71_10565 [Cycloclasticus sp. symbiont of Poecilosclerida sp. M]|nr:MAG: hypothetical protein A6F71_10565 [Cycloclasticus sp. symbiont of Poecilosclerida sp. M]
MLVQLSKYFSCSPEKVTADQVKQYLFYCKEERNLSNSHINQTISAMKILKRDVLGQPWNEGIKINRPRRNKHLPTILSKQQINAMMEATLNLKHRAIMAVLYSAGLRRDELLNLKMVDIDSQRMLIRVNNGKGNKARDTLLAKKTLGMLRDYYRHCHPKPTQYVFEGWKPAQPYSPTSIRNIVKRAAARAGIKKNIFPHSLRHAFATHMLEDGANLKLIQKLLGHSSLSSTMTYLHLAAIDPSVKSPFDQP